MNCLFRILPFNSDIGTNDGLENQPIPNYARLKDTSISNFSENIYWDLIDGENGDEISYVYHGLRKSNDDLNQQSSQNSLPINTIYNRFMLSHESPLKHIERFTKNKDCIISFLEPDWKFSQYSFHEGRLVGYEALQISTVKLLEQYSDSAKSSNSSMNSDGKFGEIFDPEIIDLTSHGKPNSWTFLDQGSFGVHSSTSTEDHNLIIREWIVQSTDNSLINLVFETDPGISIPGGNYLQREKTYTDLSPNPAEKTPGQKTVRPTLKLLRFRRCEFGIAPRILVSPYIKLDHLNDIIFRGCEDLFFGGLLDMQWWIPFQAQKPPFVSIDGFDGHNINPSHILNGTRDDYGVNGQKWIQIKDPYQTPKLITLGKMSSSMYSDTGELISSSKLNKGVLMKIHDFDAETCQIGMVCEVPLMFYDKDVSDESSTVSGTESMEHDRYWSRFSLNPFVNSIQLLALSNSICSSKIQSYEKTCLCARLYMIPLVTSPTTSPSFRSLNSLNDSDLFDENQGHNTSTKKRHSSSNLNNVANAINLFDLRIPTHVIPQSYPVELKYTWFCTAHVIVWAFDDSTWGVWDYSSASNHSRIIVSEKNFPVSSELDGATYTISAYSLSSFPGVIRPKSSGLVVVRWVRMRRVKVSKPQIRVCGAWLVTEGASGVQIEVLVDESEIRNEIKDNMDHVPTNKMVESKQQVTACCVVEENLVLGFGDGTIQVWAIGQIFDVFEVINNENLGPKILKTNSSVTCLFGPRFSIEATDGLLPLHWIASGHADGSVRIWDLMKSRNNIHLIHAHPCPVWQIFQADPELYHKLPYAPTPTEQVPPVSKMSGISVFRRKNRAKSPSKNSKQLNETNRKSSRLKPDMVSGHFASTLSSRSSSDINLSESVNQHKVLAMILMGILSVGIDGSWAILDITGGRRVLIFSPLMNYAFRLGYSSLHCNEPINCQKYESTLDARKIKKWPLIEGSLQVKFNENQKPLKPSSSMKLLAAHQNSSLKMSSNLKSSQTIDLSHEKVFDFSNLDIVVSRQISDTVMLKEHWRLDEDGGGSLLQVYHEYCTGRDSHQIEEKSLTNSRVDISSSWDLAEWNGSKTIIDVKNPQNELLKSRKSVINDAGLIKAYLDPLSETGIVVILDIKTLMAKIDVFRTSPNRRQDAAALVELTKSLIGQIWTWDICGDLDDVFIKKLGILPPKNSKSEVQMLSNIHVTTQFEPQKNPLSISPRLTSQRLMWTMSLLKSLGDAVSELEPPSVFLAAYIGANLKNHIPGFKRPALEPIANFHVDPIESVQVSSRILLASSVRFTPSQLWYIVSEWTGLLPSITLKNTNRNQAIISRKSIVATIVLATIVQTGEVREIDSLGVSHSDPDLTYEKNPIQIPSFNAGFFEYDEKFDDDRNLDWYPVLDESTKYELALSLVLLLIVGDEKSSRGPSLMATKCKIIGSEFLGKCWPVFKSVISHMTIQNLMRYLDETQIHRHSDGRMEIGQIIVQNASLPLSAFVVRCLFNYSNMPIIKVTPNVPESAMVSSKHRISHKKSKMSIMKRISSRRTPIQDSSATSASSSDESYDSSLDFDEEELRERKRLMVPPALRKSYNGAVIPGPCFAPLVPPLSPTHSFRQTILDMADSQPSWFMQILFGEISLAGLKDADWDRVKVALRSGVGYLVRHRPIIFFPQHLPKLIEVIVKGCLDPNIPFKIREKLLPIVTSVIHEIIKIYPSVSFNVNTQKLAIGISYDVSLAKTETRDQKFTPSPQQCGQVIIWDLKSATRTEIIDAHSPHNVDALSFNKPGLGISRSSSPVSRFKKQSKDSSKSIDQPSAAAKTHHHHDLILVTYSMDENLVKFWKPYSNIFSAMIASWSSSASETSSVASTSTSNSTSAESLRKAELKRQNSSGSSGSSSGSSGGFLSHLTGSGMRLYRSFPVDHMNSLSRDIRIKGNNSSNSVEASSSVDILKSKKRRLSNTDATKILNQVRFHWINERTVILERADPFESLTFTI